MAAEDRPREKVINSDIRNLTDSELIAILIGSGNRSESAIDLSRRILKAAENNLHVLAKYSIDRLVKFKGIGPAKAINVMAALELGRRRKLTQMLDRPKVTTSQDAFSLLEPVLMDIGREEFWVLLLDRGNKLISRERISEGGVFNVLVDPKIVFQKALTANACGIVLGHNHPSGESIPSTQDKRMTEKLIGGAEILDMVIIDHIIVGHHSYCSFVDEGLM